MKACLATAAALSMRYEPGSKSEKANEKESGILGSTTTQYSTAETIVIPPSIFPMGLQKGVDKEFFLLFTVFDENESWYNNANQAAGMLDSRLLSEDVEGFQDSNRMHGMGNSFAFNYNFKALSKIWFNPYL